MYTGVIEGIGPRYCPSVEDKVVRFADKDSHQVFLEPEGLGTSELYPNGISTSLPFDVQVAFVRSIAGLERAHLTRPGYAIEYDFFDPRDLQPTLQTRALGGLYFAGQINGTTGYEEAAAQGLLAGINAGLAATGREGWYPRRDEAYIGVLVDDLITRGTTEPYRMFTSRAEHRLLLREDNADQRLTPVGWQLGVVGEVRWQAYQRKQDAIAAEGARLDGAVVRPADLPESAPWSGQVLRQPVRARELLRRPDVTHADLCALPGLGAPEASDWPELDEAVVAALEIEARYSGYVERAREEIERARRHDDLPLPADLDYASVHGLSHEIRQKLAARRPPTLGHAARLPGVTPAAVSNLLVHLQKRRLRRG
jgi:tRNA uridine 5-carboxymethylaminomethyl modification enzyme